MEPCGEPCNRPRCNEPCQKKLPCEHMCVGICGEECPKLCRVCEEDADELRGCEPGAMFVELVDCGHVFEVKSLDRWMDESDAGDCDHEDVEIKHKRCPKCSTPILSSRRYGKIIKKIHADFEAVKRRIRVVDVADSEQIQKILSEVQEIKEFKAEVSEIVKAITTGRVTSEEVTKRQNQVILLKFLDTIHSLPMKSAWDKALHRKVNSLKSRVMETRDCFSEQEIKELTEELLRTKLVACFKGLMYFLENKALTLVPEDASTVNSIRSVLESGDKIGKYKKILKIQTHFGSNIYILS